MSQRLRLFVRLTYVRTLSVFLILGWAAFGDVPAEPPTLIRLMRSLAGGDPIRPYADAHVPLNVFGMAAVTGLPENWLLECHDSFASLEAVDRALAAQTSVPRLDAGMDDVLSTSRALLGLLRPQWSYRPDEAMRLMPKSRYVFVSIYRIRPGAEVDFAELAKLRRAEFDSINSNRPEIAYQIISGSPSGVYLFLAPMTTLRTLDEGLLRVPVYAEGVAKTARAMASNPDVMREHLLFRMEPRLSWLSEDFIAEDPEFWTGKPKQ